MRAIANNLKEVHIVNVRNGQSLPDLPAEQSIHGGDAYSLLREFGAYTPNGHEEITDIENHEFLAAIGVPADWREDADWWDGWNVGMIRARAQASKSPARSGVKLMIGRVIPAVRSSSPSAIAATPNPQGSRRSSVRATRTAPRP